MTPKQPALQFVRLKQKPICVIYSSPRTVRRDDWASSVCVCVCRVTGMYLCLHVTLYLLYQYLIFDWIKTGRKSSLSFQCEANPAYHQPPKSHRSRLQTLPGIQGWITPACVRTFVRFDGIFSYFCSVSAAREALALHPPPPQPFCSLFCKQQTHKNAPYSFQTHFTFPVRLIEALTVTLQCHLFYQPA